MRRVLTAGAAGVVVLAAMMVIPVAGAAEPPAVAAAHGSFVTRVGPDLRLGGKPFKIAGSNNYYLMYKSRAMVDDVFADAVAAKFNVLRASAWIDIGNADGTNSVSSGKADGVYFQYWDGTKPAYNDGADGLVHLDYVVAKAKASGIRLVMPFTNNWSDFGGMDQYVRWRGGTYHDDFYTDPTIRQWYKDWISHLLNRVNTITGVAYKDDPTIMTWELANEPRCAGSGVYPASSTCSADVTTAWADDVSKHIKSIDARHLTSVGDEGFLCDAGSTDYMFNCGAGIDTVRLATLPAIDVLSYHLYPDGWGKTVSWGTEWITRHSKEAAKIGKAVMLGEFGLRDKSIRNPVYKEWTDAVIKGRGDGFLYWMLSGTTDDGTPYPDYDGFTVYCPTPVCQTMTNAGRILAGAPSRFAPVADHDSVVTPFNTAATLNPAANDVAYRTTIDARRVDLDPSVHGRQRTKSVTGGTFATDGSGAVTFTPVVGFVGTATTPYVIRDRQGGRSNVANLEVTVKPDPAAALSLFSFEDGAQGWGPASFEVDAGTVATTTAFHTAGANGLQITSTGGHWFGATLAQPADFSTHGTISFDLRTGATGTSPLVALQTGSSWTWCQANKPWVNQGQTVTMSYDLATDFAGCTDLNEIHGFLIFFNEGQFDIDNIQAI